jgi:hypothetical protein
MLYQNNKYFSYEIYYQANIFTLIILCNIKMDLEEMSMKMLIGCKWVGIGISGELL